MTGSAWKLTTSHFALAAAFAVGLAVFPFGSANDGFNGAAAQAVSDDDADADGNANATDVDGAAEEFPTTGQERTGAVGSPGISSGEQRYADPASVNASDDDPKFRRYREAAESNDVDAAGLALARAADRPVTPDYVAEVHEQLSVRTSLTAEQIAEAANQEPLPY